MRYAILLVMMLVPAIALAGGQYSRPDSKDDANYEKANCAEIPVEVYNGPKAPRPFVVVGEIHAKGSTEKTVICKIKRIAAKSEANAVLNYKTDHGNFPSAWTGATLNHASGVAVRWTKEGEKGITQITDDLPVQVIQ